MPRRRSRDIVHRCESNPIMTIRELPFPCADICNAGAIRLGKEYVLLVTVQGLDGTYAIYAARSPDGFRFAVDALPILSPSSEESFRIYEDLGVLDARITPIDGEYFVLYNALGYHGFRLGLARTSDFVSIERIDLVSEPDTKGGAMFPRKVKGKFARLERPWDGGSIWVSYSDDLRHWGWSEAVMTPRGGHWDGSRVGTATPPTEIDQGWLILYYGAKDTSAGPLFRLGAAILDKENPSEVVGRTNVPILSPREPYERMGDLPNLVFSCGAVIEPEGVVKLYYGAANSCICLGTTTVDDIVAACTESESEF